MNKKTKLCLNCDRFITTNNYDRHFKKCINSKLKITIDIEKYRIPKSNKYKCPDCLIEFNKLGIGAHIWRVHTEDGRKFNAKKNYIKGSMIGWNKGLTKETDDRVKRCSEKINEYYLTHTGSFSGKTHTNETKKSISNSMKKRHCEGIAWNIGMSRWNNEPSYPEKFFMQVIENEFDDKNTETEFPIGKYSLDFAWIHKKKGIEIDGEQHYRFQENVDRDKQKDKLCLEMGWEILRIRWTEMFKDTKKWIQIAKEFIDN